MFKRILFLIVVLYALGFGQANNNEFRSAWVITWNYMSGGRTVEENKAVCRKILDNMKEANMNAVIWQVRQGGTAYYPSSFEPWGSYAGGEDPGYDPLKYAIEQAHLRGMEIHVWFNSFHCSSQVDGAPAKEHPEWICRDRSGNPMGESIALSPGMKAVRDYTVNVAMEIVRNYDIDGIHLDYVRWNEYASSKKMKRYARLAENKRQLDGMISKEQFEEMKRSAASRYLYDADHPYENGVPEGFDSWEDWWRSSVTEFVKTLNDSVKLEKPWVKLSAAVLGRYNWGSWQGYGDVYQDGALWFNEGYVDQLMPMHYHWKSGRGFYDMLKGDGNQSWEPWLTKGIEEKRLYTVGPGSYTFETKEEWNKHPEIVHACRQVEWVDGLQFFAYTEWASNDYWGEAGSSFFQRKTKIRPLGTVSHEAPSAPTLEIAKMDSLCYQIKVVPTENSEDALNWFVLYRNNEDAFNKDSSVIIGLGRSDSSYVFIDTIPADHSELKFFYKGAVADRYWMESSLSATVETEELPLIPAMVVNTTPNEGDTLKANDSLVFTFSKPMDMDGASGNVTISPVVEMEMTMSETGRDLVVSPKTAWNFGTDYTLVFSEAWKDSSGLKLDGDADGAEGGDFQFHFSVEGEDFYGPVASIVNPLEGDNMEGFDVEDVITVAFDEIVADNTVTHENVVLSLDGQAVDVDLIHYQTDTRSVVSFKPEGPLEQSKTYQVRFSSEISDTLDNKMDSDLVFDFTVSSSRNKTTIWIDRFTQLAGWKDPGYSGSTVGIVGNDCSFGLIKDIYVPASASKPIERYCAELKYKWAADAETTLLREYLSGGEPQGKLMNTSFILQCYIFGDGSGTRFRFALDEGDSGKNWKKHEVCKWITIDWIGWKLVEWDLSDANSVGMWDNLGDGALDNALYRLDSFQLTRPEGAAIGGTIYIDDLKAVKKTDEPVAVDEGSKNPFMKKTRLLNNYPNPFNPETVIRFNLMKNARVELDIFNITGRKVETLVKKEMNAGEHAVPFNASPYASGIYLYRLKVDGRLIDEKKMTLIK